MKSKKVPTLKIPIRIYDTPVSEMNRRISELALPSFNAYVNKLINEDVKNNKGDKK